MKLKVLNHPLIDFYMTMLRSKDTQSSKFRFLAKKVTSLMAFEIFKDLKVLPKTIETPLDKHNGVILNNQKPCIISILRAGLIMSEGITDVFDEVSIGHIGMYRDENTLKPINYVKKLPSDLNNRQCFLCDPMLATGGSAISAIKTLKQHFASDIKLVCLLASDPGIKKVHDNFPDVNIICAQKDDKLNENGFILPGLGDAGDRIFET